MVGRFFLRNGSGMILVLGSFLIARIIERRDIYDVAKEIDQGRRRTECS